MRLMVRERMLDDWRQLLTIPADDVTASDVVSFSADGGWLLGVTSLDGTRRGWSGSTWPAAPWRCSPRTRRPTWTGGAAPDTREPQIVTFMKDRAEYLVLDGSAEEDLKAIRSLHPGDPSIGAREDPESPWPVGFTNDTSSIPYFVYDPSAHSGRFLFDDRPELDQYELAAMEPFSFTSRDGLTIHGYATFPPGRSAPACRPCSTCTGARRPATSGALTPKRNGSPTAATSASRSTTGAPPGTARSSSPRATVSGAPRCTTT